jgi:hypothetical protein
VIEITARCAGSEAISHIFDTTNNADHEEQPMSLLEANDNGDAGELSAHELDAVSGGKVLEIPIGSVTIQLNFDNGCWAVWNGKDLVGGGCPK